MPDGDERRLPDGDERLLPGGDERYRPVPGILQIPAFLLGKLSPRGRRIFWFAAAAACLALAGLGVWLVPQISESKTDYAQSERTKAARALAERKRELRVEQRPRVGRSAGPGAGRLAGALERAITADVRRRARAGSVPNAAKRTECERLGRLGTRLAYTCTAVTSDLPGGDVSRAGVVGYAYRALGDPRTGRFAFCKFSGQPGEGALVGAPLVPLPRPCGGPTA